MIKPPIVANMTNVRSISGWPPKPRAAVDPEVTNSSTPMAVLNIEMDHSDQAIRVDVRVLIAFPAFSREKWPPCVQADRCDRRVVGSMRIDRSLLSALRSS